MIVRWRPSRERDREGECSSESDSSAEEDSEVDESFVEKDEVFESRDGPAGGRTARGGLGGGVSEFTEFDIDMGRGSGCGLGDPRARLVELRRACASRNAATEMRCEESVDATLSPRGRDACKTYGAVGDSRLSRLFGTVGEDACICLKDMR